MSTAASPSPPLSYDVSQLLADDFFGYTPSIALASIALVLFLLAAAIIAWQTVRAGRYKFMHTISVTGLTEAAGYVAMLYCSTKSGEVDIFSAYVVNQVFIILSPNLIQATLYWTVGLVLKACPELTQGRRWLRGWVVTTSFCLLDLGAIIVQAVGISIWATNQSSGTPDQKVIQTGYAITLAGLAVQLLGAFVFTGLTIWTHRHPRNTLIKEAITRKLFLGMYLVMAGLYVRNIFRFVEFTQGTILEWPAPEGAYVLSKKEVLFWTLDTVPILLCFAAYIAYHPSHLLPAPAAPSSEPKGTLSSIESAEDSAHNKLGEQV